MDEKVADAQPTTPATPRAFSPPAVSGSLQASDGTIFALNTRSFKAILSKNDLDKVNDFINSIKSGKIPAKDTLEDAMELMETLKDINGKFLTGSTKQQLMVELLQEVEDFNISVMDAIGLVFDAKAGKIGINLKKKGFLSWLPCSSCSCSVQK